MAESPWEQYVQTQPDALIFHHPAWESAISKTYGYPTCQVALSGAPGSIAAGIPLALVASPLTGRRAVALPFSDFCPPLGGATPRLVAALQTWRRQQHLPQVVVHWPLPAGDGVFAGEQVARHTTPLDPDPAQVFHRFHRTRVQQCITQAEKSGGTVRQQQSWESVETFYRLHLLTRQRLGTPAQPRRFFRLLWEYVISQGLGYVLLAYQGERLLAGAVFLHWNKTLTYKYSASDPQCWKLRPNHLLLWHAIRWGCEHGYEQLDWGRTDMGNKGLREFKCGWGSQEQFLHYSILADCPPAKEVAVAGGRSRRALATVIQHAPPWFCRMMGELLYGHFA